MENKLKNDWIKTPNILWNCCRRMVQCKTKQEVFEVLTVWSNHVSKEHDWFIKRLIPEELK